VEKYIACWRQKLNRIDLHIHSALSACCADEMSPIVILEQAIQKNLKVVSITDHNNVQHSILAYLLCKEKPICVIPGVELTTKEEVHLLAYFSDIKELLELEKKIHYSLPKEKNNSSILGYQVCYNLEGEIVGIDDSLRQTALNLGMDYLIDFIHSIGGIAIPAHIDKNRFSLLSQLGFLDPKEKFDAVEVSKFTWEKEDFYLGNTWNGFPVISGSDSHNLKDIGLFCIEDNNEEINDFITLKNSIIRIKNKQ